MNAILSGFCDEFEKLAISSKNLEKTYQILSRGTHVPFDKSLSQIGHLQSSFSPSKIRMVEAVSNKKALDELLDLAGEKSNLNWRAKHVLDTVVAPERDKAVKELKGSIASHFVPAGSGPQPKMSIPQSRARAIDSASPHAKQIHLSDIDPTQERHWVRSRSTRGERQEIVPTLSMERPSMDTKMREDAKRMSDMLAHFREMKLRGM